MFCAALDTVVDVDNGYLIDPTSAFTIYPPTAETYALDLSLTVSSSRFQYVDFYMDDLNCATQGDVGKKKPASKLTIQALKEIFPSLPAEVKDLVSLKK